MTRRALVLALAASATAAAGCAGARGAGTSPYRFPPAFQASQVVTVVEPGGRHEFIASVRRSAEGGEVTLFDPVFSVPLLVARTRGGEASEELLAPGPRPGDGKRLAELLRDVFGGEYALRGADAQAGVAGASVRLTGVPPEGTPCRFPASIQVAPRLGGVRVEARTVDVGCE